jgi:hypothetical protein
LILGLYGDPHLRDQIRGLKLQESELTTSIDALKKRRSLGHPGVRHHPSVPAPRNEQLNPYDEGRESW